MTELQQARKKWLDAESKICELQAENFRLLDENYRLKSQLMASQCEAAVMGDMARNLSRAMLTV